LTLSETGGTAGLWSAANITTLLGTATTPSGAAVTSLPFTVDPASTSLQAGTNGGLATDDITGNGITAVDVNGSNGFTSSIATLGQTLSGGAGKAFEIDG